MDPIEVIEQDLQSSETHVRVKCISHFPLVAKVIGPQDTQKRLLPLIFNHCFKKNPSALTHDVEEEDIKEIAEVFDKEFLLNAGGEEHCEKQLEFLEKAAGAEETVVRQAAAKSLSSCISVISPEKNSKTCIQIFKRLSGSEKWANRITSASIAPSLYEHIKNPEFRSEIMDVFKLLIRDEMPLVRAQAFKDLPSLIAVCDESFYSSHCRLFLHHLTNEVSPHHANLEIVNIAITLLREHTKKNVSTDQLLSRTWQWFEKAGESDSWRLRNAFIRKVPEICELYEKAELRQVNSDNILPVCLKILNDPEPQVREIALGKFVKAAPFMDCSPYRDALLEKITGLSEDMHQNVKENCSLHVIDFFVECKLTDGKRIYSKLSFSRKRWSKSTLRGPYELGNQKVKRKKLAEFPCICGARKSQLCGHILRAGTFFSKGLSDVPRSLSCRTNCAEKFRAWRVQCQMSKSDPLRLVTFEVAGTIRIPAVF